MSIRSALRSLPSWPALVIAPILILVVGALHYGPVYRQCTHLAEARAGFSAAVARAAQGDSRVLRLDAAVATGDWDQVRILQGPQVLAAVGSLLDCPFGWDLDAGERRAMIAQGRLGILAFVKAAEIVDYIEYRADRVRFEAGGELVARGDAVFTVGSRYGASGPFILRPATSKP